MKNLVFYLLLPLMSFPQGYTSYFTGNTTNVTTTTEFGVCLMGGATENDNAMRWLLQKANGGDVVVLRSTGSNGYNDYLYSQLGVAVNSVETLVITSAAGAINPYVLDKVSNAEMIWFAGGNQFNYVSYFKNNALEDKINNHINVKNAPIGGTSAGMAILGSSYFSAQNGSVTSAQALANPYNSLVTIGSNDFLNIPILNNVITETHFDNPDRKGRQTSFLAKLKTDFNQNFYGIASNEYVAVCIGSNGIAKVYGNYPNYQQFAYFVQPNCNVGNNIENCQVNQPLTWSFGGQALKVYKVPGTMNGTNYFDISNGWEFGQGVGGSWEHWSVINGVFNSVVGTAPNCVLDNEVFEKQAFILHPNPVKNILNIDGLSNKNYSIYDSLGRLVTISFFDAKNHINVSNLSSGIYLLKIISDEKTIVKKFIKE